MLKRDLKIYKNGLKHVHYELEGVSTIAISFVVNAGSLNELTPADQGVAHFLEHMAFNGTKAYPEGPAMERLMAANGIHLNAFTSFPITCYYHSNTRDSLETSFDALTEKVFYPLLKEESVEKERGIIIEELNRSESNPQQMHYYGLFKKLMAGTSYDHEVLGTMDSLKGMSAERLQAFHKKFYSTRNTMFITCGGISMNELEKVVASKLEQLEDVGETDHSIKFDLGRADSIRYDQQMEIENVQFMNLGRMKRVSNAEEYAAMLILNSYLFGGIASDLWQLAIVKSDIASSVMGNVEALPHYTNLEMMFATSESNQDRVLDLSKSIVSTVQDGNVDRASFDRAAGYCYGDYCRQMDNPEDFVGMSQMNIEQAGFMNGLDLKYEELLPIITKPDFNKIVKIWQEFLETRSMAEGFVLPKSKN